MDDISYLHRYGVEQEYVGFADSAKRDKAAYVTPAEFAVSWNVPFTLVTGIDIIDVSLPMSGYTVNVTYNQVRFRFHEPGYEDDPRYLPPAWLTATIRPGNHTASTLIEELNDKLVERAAVPRRIEVKPASTPFELVGKIVFVSEHPFEIDTIGSSMAAVLGFSQLIDVTSSQQIAGFTDREQLDALGNEVDLLLGSSSATKGFSLTKGKFMRQRFVASASSSLTGLSVMVEPFGEPGGLDGFVNFRVVNARTNGTVVRGAIPVRYPQMSHADMDSVVVTNPAGDMFFKTESYWLEVYDENNVDPNNCYRVCYGPGAARDSLYKVEHGVVDRWYEPTAMMAAHMRAVPFNYVMVPPGILNLASPVGYVMLRCPEVEKHMYSGRAFEASNMGLAVVNLSRGYQEKYHLVAPKRSFHPIARLSRLTFRWEAPDGSPYDFLGVDNHITFVLRYFTLPQRNDKIYSAINPHYRPDLLEEWGEAEEAEEAAELAAAYPLAPMHPCV